MVADLVLTTLALPFMLARRGKALCLAYPFLLSSTPTCDSLGTSSENQVTLASVLPFGSSGGP